MSEEKIDIKTATVKLQKYSNFRIIARNTISSIYGAECLNIKKIPHTL